MSIDDALRAVLTIESSIPEDGFTAASLGTKRSGSGVMIREDGLVLTIGYLIAEASDVRLTSLDGQVTPAHPLAYDHASGFGLVQAMGKLDLPAVKLGRTDAMKRGDAVIVAGGCEDRFINAHVVAKQEFAGYWEYLLDDAIFTSPAHPLWGGAGLLNDKGELLGVGSLLVQRVTEAGDVENINMSVPIDLLPPIFDDLLTYGRVNRPSRPWLGVYAMENDGRVIVGNVANKSPAALADLRAGDAIVSVRDASVESLADFYRKLWSVGPAGAEIPIEIVRNGRSQWLRIKSADRADYLKKPRLH